MKEQFFKDKAIVLAVRRSGDYDAVIECMGLERGRSILFAKGLRRPTSKLRAFLQGYQAIHIEGLQGRAALPRLTGAEPLWTQSIPSTVEVLGHQAYWAELTHLFLEEDMPEKNIYYLWIACLKALDKVAIDILSWYFQYHLLDTLGYGVTLDGCKFCTESFSKGEAKGYGLDGQPFHLKCMQEPTLAHRTLNAETEAILHKIDTTKVLELAPLRVSSGATNMLWQYFDQRIAYHLGYLPTQRTYLQKMNGTIDKLL